MTEKEMRELDAWIAEHVFPYSRLNYKGGEWPHYTTDPAAAMQVLEKCGEKWERAECFYLGRVGEEWSIGLASERVEGVAETLPLAIALFSKKLFST